MKTEKLKIKVQRERDAVIFFLVPHFRKEIKFAKQKDSSAMKRVVESGAISFSFFRKL